MSEQPGTTTADWHGSTPITRSRTWGRGRCAPTAWGSRKVRGDGSVIFLGHRFVAPPDAVTRPVPGEWLLFYNYGVDYDRESGPVCGEWTAPADPDGYIRRAFWTIEEAA